MGVGLYLFGACLKVVADRIDWIELIVPYYRNWVHNKQLIHPAPFRCSANGGAFAPPVLLVAAQEFVFVIVLSSVVVKNK